MTRQLIVLATLSLFVATPSGGAPPPGGGIAQPVRVERDVVPERDVLTHQISTGRPNGTGIYAIYRERATNSPKLGHLIVTSTSAPRGYTPNTEHFIWFEEASAWPRSFYLHSDTVPSVEQLLVRAKRVDRYNNRIGCSRATTNVTGTSRWKTEIKQKNALVHVATLSKTATTLLGFWVADTECLAIAPGTDGWIDLSESTETFSPKSWGTPTR